MASTTISDKIRKQLAALPARPGVYLMRNAAGEVIYVGKAARLKDRVRSYFGSPHGMEPKTLALRQQIDDFEFIVVTTPGEALLLEATLIKRHQPFFNIRLKDDKRYPYLKIDVQNPWPRVTITRRIEKDGARYFGPYASTGSVRATLDLVKKLFPWRSCTKEITGTDARPCLDYYIKRCIAPCTAFCTREEYAEVIEQVVLFLEGKAGDVVKRLAGQMEEAAERMEFERAAMIRDQLRALERTIEKQMVHTTKKEDLDVFGLARDGDQACVQVFFIRGTQMIGRDTFTIDGASGETDASVLSSFLQQYYESAQYIPKLVVVPAEPSDREEIEAMLTSRRNAMVEIRQPQRGEKRRLVQLAGENAKEALDMMRVKWLADASKTDQALEQLREELTLPEIPHRIECYDNSNIQGTSPVSSMVVFIDGKPANSQYRRFRVKTVTGADDFATMAEIMRRRFRHAEGTRTEDSGLSDLAPMADAGPGTRDSGLTQHSALSTQHSGSGVGDVPMADAGPGTRDSGLTQHSALSTQHSGSGVGDVPVADSGPGTRDSGLTQHSALSTQHPGLGVGDAPMADAGPGTRDSGLTQHSALSTQHSGSGVGDVPMADAGPGTRDSGLPQHSALSTQHSEWPMPDLVIIDGGKGQLGAAAEAMREVGVHHIPVVGLAKRFEEIYVPGEEEPIVLPRGSEALFLVQRIRDEAHRFAITFHRQVRGKTQIASALDSIQGIGPKRKKALLKKFGSVKAIREAEVEEIASTVGFTRALAEKVKAGV